MFAIIEVVLRFVYNPPRHKNDPQLSLTYHSELGFKLPEHFDGYSLEAKVKLNANGFRTIDVHQSSKDKTRIVAIGDSFLFGQGVNLHDTFAHKLNSKNIEYINLAVPGYDTQQEYRCLEIYGWNYLPQEVHLHFFVNDLYFNATPMTFQHLTGKTKSDNNALFKHSTSLTLLGKSFISYQDPHNVMKRALRFSDPSDSELVDWQSLWNKNFEVLESIKSSCDKHAVSLKVIIHPIPYQSSSRGERYQSVLTPMLLKSGIDYLDLRPFIK